jgi:transcription initiation factor TFIIH subunit 4
MSVLERLHILTLVPEPPVPRAYRLNRSFALSLRQALTGGGSGHSFGAPINTPLAQKMSVEDLDAWARGQWESILYYMVGSTGAAMNTVGSKISSGTKALLRMGNFVTVRGEKAAITKEGFTFLLQEANAQVWSLLIVYLENSASVKSQSL